MAITNWLGRSVALICVMGLIGTARPLAAQPAEGTGRAREDASRRACFHPRPLPQCGTFWIMQFGTLHYLTTLAGEQRRMLWSWELAYMANKSPANGVGGGVFVAVNDQQLRSGLRVRSRKWLGSRASFDLAPGVILLRSDSGLDVQFVPGVALLSSIGAFEWIRGNAQVEYGRGSFGAQLGVTLGSHAAWVGVLLPAVFIVALLGDGS